jgi:hypothetical protein
MSPGSIINAGIHDMPEIKNIFMNSSEGLNSSRRKTETPTKNSAI